MTGAYLTYALCFASLLLNALLIAITLANRSDNSRDQRADRDDDLSFHANPYADKEQRNRGY